jgi:hypothetical protein
MIRRIVAVIGAGALVGAVAGGVTAGRELHGQSRANWPHEQAVRS